MQLHPRAPDDADAFAEIDLRMTRRMSERNEHFPRPRPRQAHIVLHHRIAAGKPCSSAAVRKSAWPYAFASAPASCQLPGSRRSPESTVPASVFPPACSEHSPAAPNSGTFSPRVPGSIRRHAASRPLFPRRKQTSEPLRRSPRQHFASSLPKSKSGKVQPKKWTGFTPSPRGHARCRSSADYCSAVLARPSSPRTCGDRAAYVVRVLGGHRLRKLGEDVTRTLESQPRQWKVVETVREKFTCRDCEKIPRRPRPSMPSQGDGRDRACWR